MVLNKSNGVIKKYYYLLLQSQVLSHEDNVVIEPFDEDFDLLEDKVIVLQQGEVNWNVEKNRDKVKKVITSNVLILDHIGRLVYTVLLEFPINRKIFSNNIPWNERENILYYHGRIIPDKLPLEELKKLEEYNIPVVLQGPICKEYWTNKDIELNEFITYKEEIKKLKNITFLPAITDEKELAANLNKYKFYFSLSTGEAFNVALKEAISCGTVPLVKDLEAYYWCKKSCIKINTCENIKNFYEHSKNKDLTEYSNLISKELERLSFSNTYEKYLAGYWHKLWSTGEIYIDFEIQELVNNYSKYVTTVMSCSGHRDALTTYIMWEDTDEEFYYEVRSKLRYAYFDWHIYRFEKDGRKIAELTIMNKKTESVKFLNRIVHYSDINNIEESIEFYYMILHDLKVLMV